MKKVIAFNGSPRKDGNTAQLLQAALEGAKQTGAETKFVQISDLEFTGCGACFACRLLGSKNYADCIKKDDATLILHEIEQADAVFFGSPIYYGKISSDMQRLFERVLNPYNVVEPYHASLWPHKIEAAMFLTLDAPSLDKAGVFFPVSSIIKRLFGTMNMFVSTETYRFLDGYDKYYAPIYDAAKRKEIYDDKFPKDLKKAEALGKKLTLQAERTPNPYREAHFKWVKENFGEV